MACFCIVAFGHLGAAAGTVSTTEPELCICFGTLILPLNGLAS